MCATTCNFKFFLNCFYVNFISAANKQLFLYHLMVMMQNGEGTLMRQASYWFLKGTN